MLAWATVLLVSCARSLPKANPPQAAPTIGSMLIPAQLAVRTDTFIVRNQNDSVGTVLVVYVGGPDSIIDSIQALGQQAVVVFDLRSGTATTVTDSIREEIVHLRYSQNEMRGLRVAINKTGRRDSVNLFHQLPPGTLDRRSLALVLQLIPLKDGATWSFPMFDSWSQKVVSVWVAVEGPTWRRIKAGTIAVYRLDVRGHMFILPRVFYVTADSPRRILRMEQGTVSWELMNRRLQ